MPNSVPELSIRSQKRADSVAETDYLHLRVVYHTRTTRSSLSYRPRFLRRVPATGTAVTSRNKREGKCEICVLTYMPIVQLICGPTRSCTLLRIQCRESLGMQVGHLPSAAWRWGPLTS